MKNSSHSKLPALFIPFSADWPNWLGPTQDGVSAEKDFGNDLDNLQWKTKVGVGFSSVAVADGRLFTMGHDGQKRGGKETGLPECEDSKANLTDPYEVSLVDYLHEGGPCSTPQSMEVRSMPLASMVSSMLIRQVAAKKYGPRI